MGELSGFGVRGFRSLYGELQTLPSLTKINLIAGQNNSGKSNVLRVVQQMNDLILQGPEGLDLPEVANRSPFELIIRLGDRATVHSEFCAQENLTTHSAVESVRTILKDPAFDLFNDGSVWLKIFHGSGGEKQPASYRQSTELGSAGSVTQYVQARGMTHTTDPRQNAEIFLNQLRKLLQIPDVQVVQAFRRIEDTYVDSKPLIESLVEYQNPVREKDTDRERFEAIQTFLQAVIDDPTATLAVPHTAEVVNVRRGENGDLLLPLESLGTGITQVIMLAAYATVKRNTVVTMEEPEVHLHPLLQRKLLRYLFEKTDNQYIIATHSAHLLDSAIASVFHTTFTQHGTVISPAGNPAELSEVCYDLGYRPSDLLQTNCVIWVEGPSDRTYISRWLYLMNPDLIEGIHYSIMFYGGRLLNHLSAEDPEVTEFIKLRRLNRHLAVVMDSDKASPHMRINKTKTRVRKEIDEGAEPGRAWVTEGRYIENYIPRDELTKVLKSLYEGKACEPNVDKYADALRPAGEKPKWNPDKIAIAKEVCKHWKSGLHYLDLYGQIIGLAELVEAANGQQQPPQRPPKCEPEFEWD